MILVHSFLSPRLRSTLVEGLCSLALLLGLLSTAHASESIPTPNVAPLTGTTQASRDLAPPDNNAESETPTFPETTEQPSVTAGIASAASESTKATRDDSLTPPTVSPATNEALTARTLRFILRDAATATRARRLREGTLAVLTGGGLFGAGFVADGPNHSWAHTLWVSGAVSALGGLGAVLVPTDVETLSNDSENLSDEEVRRQLAALADEAKLERRVGAVFGGLLGGAGIVVGALALDERWSDLNSDQSKLVGSGLVIAGTSAIGNALFDWCVPSPVERGQILSEELSLRVTAGASPNGATFQLSGSF